MKRSPYPADCSVTVQSGQLIQRAIDDAQQDAVICLGEGDWEENLKIEKSLTLRGLGQEETIIKRREAGYPVVWIKTPGDGAKQVRVKVEELAITGAYGGCADWHKGICADGLLIGGSAEVEIADSTISGNKRNGFFIRDSARVSITNSAISRNGHYGLWVWHSAWADIRDCAISENGLGVSGGMGTARDGIVVRDSAWLRIASSIVSRNGYRGVLLTDTTQAEIRSSSIEGSPQEGIWLRGAAQAAISDTRISGNRDGILLWGRAVATVVRNRIISNRGYGVALYHRPCYEADEAFQGHISGRANIIPGPREPDGNDMGAVCPPELEFLMNEGGGDYP